MIQVHFFSITCVLILFKFCITLYTHLPAWYDTSRHHVPFPWVMYIDVIDSVILFHHKTNGKTAFATLVPQVPFIICLVYLLILDYLNSLSMSMSMSEPTTSCIVAIIDTYIIYHTCHHHGVSYHHFMFIRYVIHTYRSVWFLDVPHNTAIVWQCDPISHITWRISDMRYEFVTTEHKTDAWYIKANTSRACFLISPNYSLVIAVNTPTISCG